MFWRNERLWRWLRSKRTNARRVRLIDFLFASLAGDGVWSSPARENGKRGARAAYPFPPEHFPSWFSTRAIPLLPGLPCSTSTRPQVGFFFVFFLSSTLVPHSLLSCRGFILSYFFYLLVFYFYLSFPSSIAHDCIPSANAKQTKKPNPL